MVSELKKKTERSEQAKGKLEAELVSERAAHAGQSEDTVGRVAELETAAAAAEVGPRR
jgi:hypothetical protein